MEGAEVTVKSQLIKIVADLEAIQKKSLELSNQFKTMSKDVGKETKEQTKQVETGLQHLQAFGRRVADQLRKDFSTLASVGSLTSGLKLSENFSGSVKEAVNLSDTVRRFGGVLGLAQSQFVTFQTRMQRGLGEIGASSEAAANALKGLAETPVRGQANLIAYARTAAELASISGEKGQEGSIAKGAAGIILSRGGNVNDLNQLSAVTREILQIRKATGKSVTEVTGALSGIYSGTNKDFQGALQHGGSTTLASAALVGGPQATGFLEKYLSMDRISRMGLEAQGFKNIIGSNGGLNSKAIMATMAAAKSRGLGDAQAGLKTFGLGDDEARGFIRLAEALKANEAVIQGARNQVVNLNQEYRKTMGLGDSFRANINRIKGIFSPAISAASQGMSNVLGGTSQSALGSGAVVGGGAILAAILTGGGIRGIGSSLLGGELKSKAVESITGEHVQKVEVINFPSAFGVPGSSLATGAASVATSIGVGTAAVAAGGAIAGVVATKWNADRGIIVPTGVPGIGNSSMGGPHGFDFKQFMDGLKDVFRSAPAQAVKVDLNKKDLKAAIRPGRGSGN